MKTISLDEVYDAVGVENPWWDNGEIPMRITQFPQRSYLDGFRALVEQNSAIRSVILMGPRRVGKTVLILQTIAGLLNRNVQATNILYVSLDRPLYNGLALETLVRHHLKDRGNQQRHYFFLDEIQYVRDWERELKSLTDLYPQHRFVASGSAAATLRTKSTESGAGRFTDFLLPPLTFDEFIRFHQERNPSIERLNHYADDGFREPTALSSLDILYLNTLFEKYLAFGGYPEAALSIDIQQNMDRFIREDIVEKVLLRDLPSLYGIQDTRELNSLFTALCYNSAGEVSLEKLSQRSAVSKNTIKRYIEYLQTAFLIRIISRIDQNAARFQRQTNFKVYLTNPSLRAALFRPLSQDDDDFGHMAETAIFSQWFHNPGAEGLHYARWDSGEIDIVSLKDEKPRWFVEIKWSDRHVGRATELPAVAQFLARHGASLVDCAVTTRTRFGDINVQGKTVNLIPTAIYCWQVARNATKTRIGRQAAFDF